MIQLIDYLQKRIKTVIQTCYGLLVFIVIFALLVDRSHAHTWIEHALPFLWSLFGFAAAAIIIGFASWYGRSGIQARTNYYECPLQKDCPPKESESTNA